MTDQFVAPAENAALAAYNAADPLAYAGILPGADINRWIAGCADGPFTPDETLQKGWLHLERGLHLAYIARSRRSYKTVVAARQRGRQLQSDSFQTNFGQRDLGEAIDLFETVLDTPDASTLRRAQAHLSIGALPLWALSRTDGRPQPFLEHYRTRQALATAEIMPLFDRPELTPQERAFCWGLGLLLVFNGLESNDQLVALPTPPRSYETPSSSPRPASVWVVAHKKEKRLCVTDKDEIPDLDQDYPLYPRHIEPKEPADPNRMLLLRACANMIMGLPNSASEQQTLELSAANLAERVKELAGIKPSSSLNLPSITEAQTMYSHWRTKQDAPEGPAVVDIEPVAASPLSLEGVSKETLLGWYGEQVSSRQLTLGEGLLLDGLLGTFGQNEIASLSAADTLAFNRLRVECAAALVLHDYATAANHLADARASLESLQRTLIQNEDSIGVYEAAVDLERVKLYEHVVASKSIDEEVVAEYGEGLTELLGEMISEYKRILKSTRGDDKKLAEKRWLDLIEPALNAVIAMSRKDELQVAMPSLPRQRGTADFPGWDLNVWPVTANGKVALSAYRKLRFVGEGKTIMRQGNVALVPLPLVQQGKGSTLLQILKTASAGKGKERVDKQFALCQPVFTAAINAGRPKQKD